MTIQQIIDIPLESIVWRHNIRSTIDPARVATVAASLDMHGQLVPIRVRRAATDYEGQEGMHRFLGMQKLGWKTAKAIVDNRPLGEAEDIEIQLVVNTVRTDISIPDRARNIFKLIELTGKTASEVGKRVSLSDTTITKLMGIRTLPEWILDLISAGRIGLNPAYEISKEKDLEKQAELARDFANGRINRDGVARAVRRVKHPVAASNGVTVKRAAVSLGNGRSVTVAGESLDVEVFIAACKSAMDKAKQARAQALTFQTFLKVARDQAKG